MDAQEAPRIETGFDRLHRLPQQMPLATGMHLHIVAVGLDPVDLVDPQEAQAAARLHDQPVGRRLGRQRLQEFADARPDGVVARLDVAARATQRGVEAFRIERLQQVIHGVHVERLDRVLVVGGDKHHRRHPFGADLSNDLEAGQARHLDVEEDERGLEVEDRAHRGGAVLRVTHDLDAGPVRQQEPDTFPRERFVVDDEDAERLCGGHGHHAGSRRAGSTRNGNTIRAMQPPPDASSEKTPRPP